jgi:hypothetical protein
MKRGARHAADANDARRRLCGRRNTDLTALPFPHRAPIPRVTAPTRHTAQESTMNQQAPLQLLRPHDHAAVADAARRRAHQLRAEAEQAFFTAIARSLRRIARRAWTAVNGNHPAPHARC